MLLVESCIMIVATVEEDDFIHPNLHISILTTRSILIISFVFSFDITDFTHGIEPIEFIRHSSFAIRHLFSWSL